MSVLAEPPTTEPPVSPPTARDLTLVAAPAPAPAAPAPPAAAPSPDGARRVVVRLSDGETILVGMTPSLERATALARDWTHRLTEENGEWPRVGDRFIRPDAIVSVDVLRAG